jgi:hypothetical protein
LVIGGVYLAYLWFVRREVLDEGAGEDLFTADRTVTK